MSGVLMLYVFEFITMAFPKAGILVKTVPITVSTLLFLICIFLFRKQILNVFGRFKEFFILYLIFSTFAVWVMILNKGLSAHYITFTLVLIGSPLAIGIGYAADGHMAYRLLMVALAVVSLFEILQWVLGINRTVIPGITVAFGDSIDTKPIGYGFSGMEALKMPSTYQNGNGAGIFLLLGLPVAFNWRAECRMDRILKAAGIFFGCAGMILCGSRSAIIPFLIILPFVLYLCLRSLTYRTQLLYCAGMLFLSLAAVTFILYSRGGVSAFVLQRYVSQTLQDPSASGRVGQYGTLYQTVHGMAAGPFMEFLLRGQAWGGETYVEGLLYVLSLYGLPAFLAFAGALILPVVRVFGVSKASALGMLAVLVAFCIDNSFIFPPSLITYYFLAGLSLKALPGTEEERKVVTCAPVGGLLRKI